MQASETFSHPPCTYFSISPRRFWHSTETPERVLVLTAWLGTILAGIALGIASIVFEWSGLPLHFAGVDVYIDLYPPLIFAMLWTLWFGFWWGFVPAYLSTLVLALYSGMPLGWSLLFSFADPLGLALFTMAYRAVPIPYSLRSLNALLFFVLLSFVAGIFGSTGSFIWISTSASPIGQPQVLPIWEGWWLGTFLQDVLIVGPLLFLISPAMARWRALRGWETPAAPARRGQSLAGGGVILGGVLLFLYLSVDLNIQHYTAVAADGSLDSVHKAAQSLVESTRALYWVMATIVLFASYFGYQLFDHWTSSLRHAARELAASNADLVRAKDQAEEAARAKSTFLATMSHEIRTPMNGVISLAEILNQSHLDSEQRGMVRVLKDSANALLTVINDILDFSKIEAGKMDLDFVPFSLVETVESVANLLANRAEERGLELSVWVDPDLPDQRCGDPMRLRQILINLAGNALKFTTQGGVSITISRHDGSAVRFAVQDTGVGMTETQQAQLFQPFVQLDTTATRKFGGTGLGLSISRRLVEMMGGTIGLASKPGQGSTFWFTLPLPWQPAAQEGAAAPDMRGMKVAVLDGPRAEETPLWRYLTHAGADLISVPIGPETVQALRRRSETDHHPDVALIDATTHAEGLALGAAIMADSRLASTKVILLSSLSQVSTLNQAQRSGFFAALTRPVQRQRLWRTVVAATRRVPLDDAFDIQAAAIPVYLPPTLDQARAANAVILVAEDNPTNQLVIGKVLERLGYAAVMVGNGAEALDMLAREHFGLLITDCHMPVMDGFELARRVRQGQPAYGHSLPILALTADALKGTEEICHAAGMDDYLSKPIEAPRLDEAILRWLPQAARLRKALPPAGRDPGSRPPSGPIADDTGPDDADDAPLLPTSRLVSLFGAADAPESHAMLRLLADTLASQLDLVRMALSNGDHTAGRLAAHSAAGAAFNAGAHRVGQIFSAIERAFIAGDVDSARLLLVDLSALCDRLRLEVETLLAPG